MSECINEANIVQKSPQKTQNKLEAFQKNRKEKNSQAYNRKRELAK